MSSAWLATLVHGISLVDEKMSYRLASTMLSLRQYRRNLPARYSNGGRTSLKDIMTQKDLVIQTLEAYASSEYDSEDDIVRGLCSAGVARLLAERMLVLVPLAFGRVLLSHLEEMEFSMSAILTANDGSLKSIDLRTDEIFRSALEMATLMFHEGPRHLFQAAANASAEVAVVNKMLYAGVKLAGLRFTEPRFLRLSFEEWTSPNASSS